MFRVDASSLESYFGFDRQRQPELEKLDALIRGAAPNLKRYFHEGTPAGEAGMRMKMIGYGRFRYAIKSGKESPWPVVGVALQKNYISVYFAITKDGAPLIDSFVGTLGECRSGLNNFSFVRFEDLNAAAVSTLVAEAAAIYRADPENPVRCLQGQ